MFLDRLKAEAVRLQAKCDELSQKIKELDSEYQTKKLIKEAEFQKWYADEYLRIKKSMADLEVICLQQRAEFEHDYHSGMEKRKSELAKVDAMIEERTKYHGVHDEHLKDLGNIMREVIEALKTKGSSAR